MELGEETETLNCSTHNHPFDEMDHVDEVEVNELTKISNYSKQTEENMDETECDPRVFDQMKEYFCSGEITKEKRIEYRELNLKK